MNIKRCVLALILAYLSLVSLLAKAEEQQHPTPPPSGKMVDVGGYRVHLYCTGTGSPTVVIVGAGLSPDWGLVQPEVARFTQVCAYDHSGTLWSDSGPKDSCSLRVNEIHLALKNAGIPGPYVLVGHSLGALVARLYAGKYPDEVAGMVFVDHASRMPPPSNVTATTSPSATTAPSTQAKPAPTFVGIESDPNFNKLSPHDREIHNWFMAQPQSQKVFQTNGEIMPQCEAEADALMQKHPYPLGGRPLIDVSTDMFRSAGYVQLQAELLSLSRNSKEMVADKSTHFVIIDRPDVVVDAINQVVAAARNHTHLQPTSLPPAENPPHPISSGGSTLQPDKKS